MRVVMVSLNYNFIFTCVDTHSISFMTCLILSWKHFFRMWHFYDNLFPETCYCYETNHFHGTQHSISDVIVLLSAMKDPCMLHAYTINFIN